MQIVWNEGVKYYSISHYEVAQYYRLNQIIFDAVLIDRIVPIS